MKSWTLTLNFIFRDKWNFLCSFIPVVLGIVIYVSSIGWIFSDVFPLGKDLVHRLVSSNSWGTVLSFFLGALLTIFLYFLINWTFVLVVGVLATPFYDFLSERVEKTILGTDLKNISFGKNFLPGMMAQLKRTLLLITLLILSFFVGVIPFLTPVSFVFSIYLVAWSFLDYSWSRHCLTARETLKDLRQGFFRYGLPGFVYLFLLTIPVVNLLIAPFAVVQYTLLYNHQNLAAYSRKTP